MGKAFVVDRGLIADIGYSSGCNTINEIIRQHALAKARAYDLWLMLNPAVLFIMIKELSE